MPQLSKDATQATRLHSTIRAAVQAERRAMHAIAHGLAEMKQTQYYKQLGYAGLLEYAEAEFGFACRKTQQLARAGEKLRDLPRLDQAFALGALGRTKVRTVVAVATPDNEDEWLRLAAETSSRELEELVSRCRPGEAPPDLRDEDLEVLEYAWATIRFEKHHYEQLMRAAVKVRTRLGDPELSFSQILLLLAERELERGDEDDLERAHVCAIRDVPRRVQGARLPSPSTNPRRRRPSIAGVRYHLEWNAYMSAWVRSG